MAEHKFGIMLLALLVSLPAAAREQIRIVGSSTVFPFISAAAEQYGRMGARTPIVESNGTGGGFKMFCQGVGEHYPDISNASRPMKTSERNHCAKHGIHNVLELTIGYDGIVVANQLSAPTFHLTKRQLFLALARQVPRGGKLVNNHYQNWNEVDKSLPRLPIEVYGPPPAEGTRDALVEMVMHEGCRGIHEYEVAYPDEKLRNQQCGAMREDGRFIELLGGNVMVQKLLNNPYALAIFSYSYLDQNRAAVKANPIEGVLPTTENIIQQRYSVARSLFVYIKREHLSQTAGLKEFVRFLMSDSAIGDDGFLSIKGLIPSSAKERREMQNRAASL